jgi:hypothetical protein
MVSSNEKRLKLLYEVVCKKCDYRFKGEMKMNNFLLTMLIGAMAGTIDILPMIKMKLDKYAIVSAFLFYFIAAFIISGTDLFGMEWWLKGGVITLALAVPMIIIVAKEDKGSIIPMGVMAIFLGTLIGVAEYYVLS